MRSAVDSLLLDQIVQRLSSEFSPLVIYLFGSQVWGKPHKSSDIDLLVVLDSSDLDAAERSRRGLHALKGIHADVDLLVMTASELETKKEHPSTLVYKVLHNGVKLYEAA